MYPGLIGENFYQVVSFKHKLIFLTPPRCSTYSLKDLLNKGNIKMDEPLRPISIPFYHATLSEIIYAYNINLKDLKDYKIIQITRNPIDRFISSYFYQLLNFKFNHNFEDFISKVERFKYLLPENPNEFFLNFYQNEEYKWYQYSVNQHGGVRFYYNQTWWNNISSKIKVNYFKLEDITKDITPLLDCLDLDLPLTYNQINSYSSSNPNFIEVKNSIHFYKNRIYNLFKKDFKKLNYAL